MNNLVIIIGFFEMVAGVFYNSIPASILGFSFIYFGIKMKEFEILEKQEEA